MGMVMWPNTSLCGLRPEGSGDKDVLLCDPQRDVG